MEKEYLSIKEFAAAVGVSQQAVYKQLNNKLKPYLKVVDNKKMLDKSAFKLFSEKIKLNQDEQQVKQPLNNELNEKLIAMLQKELEEKGNQLHEKDKQIERLQQALDQAQRLNAMDKQKILELEDKMAAEQIQEQEQQAKKKWWQFGK